MLNLPGQDISSSCGFAFETILCSDSFIATPGHIEQARDGIYDVALANLLFISRLKIALQQPACFSQAFEVLCSSIDLTVNTGFLPSSYNAGVWRSKPLLVLINICSSSSALCTIALTTNGAERHHH